MYSQAVNWWTIWSILDIIKGTIPPSHNKTQSHNSTLRLNTSLILNEMTVAWIIQTERGSLSLREAYPCGCSQVWIYSWWRWKIMKLSVCTGEGFSICAQLERNYPAKGKCHLICKWEDKCIYQVPLFESMREHLFWGFFVPQWKRQMELLKWAVNRRLVVDIRDFKFILKSWHMSVHTVTLCEEQAFTFSYNDHLHHITFKHARQDMSHQDGLGRQWN